MSKYTEREFKEKENNRRNRRRLDNFEDLYNDYGDDEWTEIPEVVKKKCIAKVKRRKKG